MKNFFFSKHFSTFGWAFLGFVAGYVVVHSLETKTARAKNNDGKLVTEMLEIIDKKGVRRMTLSTVGNGTPGVWLYDSNGKARLNIGLYEDNQPFVVLNDENEMAVEILRTVAPSSAPVLVLKNKGQDKIVMGLNFNGALEPFFVQYDKNGSKQSLFGKY